MKLRTSTRSAVELAGNADGHTDWCTRGHHCGLGEHRAAPVTLRVPGRGVVVLTRVKAADGSEDVEIRARVKLAAGGRARAHLARILFEVDALLGRVTARIPQ